MSTQTASRPHEMGFRSDVIEKTLAHKIGGVRGIHNMAKYSTDRNRLRQVWAGQIERLIAANVVLLERAA